MIRDERLFALETLARLEFGAIVADTLVTAQKLRIALKDQSFLDVWLSEGREGVYAFHWERRHLDGTLYRHDNIPHARWRHVATWPKHFHNGSAETVEESAIPDEAEEGLRFVLRFIHEKSN